MTWREEQQRRAIVDAVAGVVVLVAVAVIIFLILELSKGGI